MTEDCEICDNETDNQPFEDWCASYLLISDINSQKCDYLTLRRA